MLSGEKTKLKSEEGSESKRTRRVMMRKRMRKKGRARRALRGGTAGSMRDERKEEVRRLAYPMRRLYSTRRLVPRLS